MPADIIGREEEVAAIAAFLAGPPDGERVLLIEGDAGIGKTTVWQAGVTEARKRGFDVLLAAPSEAERALSFAALADLLEPKLATAVERLPTPQRRALRVALLLDDAEGVPPDPRAIASAVGGALGLLASDRPVLVAIDDAQWLDPSSAAALAFVSRRVGEHPIRFLSAQRPGDVETAFPRDRTSRIAMGPLSFGALRRLLDDRLGRRYSRPMLRRLHEASGGNPFYAIEVARVLDPDRELPAGEPLPVPPQLGELLQARVRALPTRTLDLLQAATALAHPNLELIAQATRARDPRSGIRPAVNAGVVTLDRGRVRFAHPLFAEALRATLSRGEERAVHRRLADIVQEPEARARHLALATEEKDEAVAETLEQAASAASARGAPAAAAELAEDALRVTPDGSPALARRTLVAAEYHHAAGQTQRARQLVEALVGREQAGHGRAVALERLARIVNVPATSIRLLEQARVEAGDDLALTIMIEQALAGQAEVAWRDLPGAAAHLRRALGLAEKLGDRSVLAQVLGAVVHVETFLGHGLDRAAMERAMAISEGVEEIPLANHPRWIKASVLDLVDEIAASRSLLEALCEEAAARGDEPALGMFIMELSWIAWRAGDWPAALRYSEEADELAALGGLETLRAYTMARRTWAYAHLGRVEDARAAAVEGLAQADRVEALLAQYDMRHALGVLALSLGDAQEALHQLDPLVARIRGAGIREPGFMRSLPDEVEALIALGETETAAELMNPFEADAERLDRAWGLAAAARCRGLLAGAVNDFESAEDAFEQSLRQHDRLAEPFDLARTLLAYGSVARRAKKRGRSRDLLERGLRIFEGLGARLWVERGRAELARIGGRAPSTGELTPTEARVAGLVAEGRSNKEIAAALFVTPKTVDTNLSRIYAKLGVHSRTALARRVSERSGSNA